MGIEWVSGPIPFAAHDGKYIVRGENDYEYIVEKKLAKFFVTDGREFRDTDGVARHCLLEPAPSPPAPEVALPEWPELRRGMDCTGVPWVAARIDYMSDCPWRHTTSQGIAQVTDGYMDNHRNNCETLDPNSLTTELAALRGELAEYKKHSGYEIAAQRRDERDAARAQLATATAERDSLLEQRDELHHETQRLRGLLIALESDITAGLAKQTK